MNRWIEVEKFDNRYEVKALQDCGVQWTVDGCTHYTATSLLRAGEVYLNFEVAEGVTFRAVAPDGQSLETVHGSWRSYEAMHARDLAEAKAQLVTVEAEHRALVESASGLRRAFLDQHGPRLSGPYIQCEHCEGYDGTPDFPCDVYTFARDWEEEPSDPAMGAYPAGVRVRCLSSGRHGTVVVDKPGLASDGVIRVLWDGNTGGVYARPENLSVVVDRD